MIKLQVIGHLGKDCIANSVNGKSVINFSVAHSEKFKDAQGVQKERTTWVECAYWTEKTGIAPYLKKGQLVYAEGVPEVRSYQKNDGSTGVAMNMRVISVQLLGSANKSENNTGGDSTATGNFQQNRPEPVHSDVNEASTDDLPF